LSAWFVWFLLSAFGTIRIAKSCRNGHFVRALVPTRKPLGHPLRWRSPVRWLWLRLGSSSKSLHSLRGVTIIHASKQWWSRTGTARMYVPACTYVSESLDQQNLHVPNTTKVIYYRLSLSLSLFIGRGVWSSTHAYFCYPWVHYTSNENTHTQIYVLCALK